MRTVRRLRLRFLLDLRSSPTVLSTLLLFALSNLYQAHHNQSVSPLTQSTVHSAASLISVNDSKNHCFICCHIQTPYGGLGQAHQKHFVVRAVFILTLWYLTHLSMVTKCLWWTWGDSHPRPEHFSLCFIQQ